ncbi:MAG: zinc ribbon domain-containing protein [Chloroflexi bacterium]|nr:zinc ribbon domain-containing protein [Chloroflexota bacterium]
MKCTNCGTDNKEGLRFCEECGQPLNQASSIPTDGNACPACGYTNRAGVRFCEECGSSLTGMPRRGQSKQRKTSFQLGKKLYVAGGLVSGVLLICCVAGIIIFAPRASNPPPVAYNNSQPTEDVVVNTATGEPATAIAEASNEIMYGPADGGFDHQLGQAQWREAGLYVSDFIAEVTFYNPAPAYDAEQTWDYGIAFRGRDERWMLLSIFSDGGWFLMCGISGENSFPETGVLSSFNGGAGDPNTIELYANGTTGRLSVNGEHVSGLDLSCASGPGDVSLSANFHNPALEGAVTSFSGFTVRAVGGEMADVAPIITEPPVEQPAQPSTGSGCTDRAELLSETVKSGAVYPSHSSFVKTWIVKNAGTCTWTTDYAMNFINGDQMDAESAVRLTGEVQPNASTLIAAEMTSPVNSGSYRGDWFLSSSSGDTFGWGSNADKAFEVSIQVDEEAMAVPELGSADASFETEMPGMGGGAATDTDEDGLNDGFEEWIANAFVPIFQYDEDEDVPREQVMRFYQVTPIYKTSPNVWNYPQYQFPEYQGPPGILITYVVAYTWDTGDAVLGIEAHAGDAEAIRIFLVNPRNDPFTWNPVVIMIKRHFDDPEAYYSYQFQWSQTHPIVWVSEDKHAMYSNWEECDDYSVGFEYCDSKGYQINSPIVSGGDGFNVGERLNHPFSEIPNNTLGLFANEFVWSSSASKLPVYDNQGNVIGSYDAAENFCGGYSGSKCGGGMDGKWWPMSNPQSRGYLARLLSNYANNSYKAFYGAEYEICFYTGDVDHAGTDYFVDIDLLGTAHSQSFYNFDNASKNFERGKTDCFQVGSYNLEEKLTGLTVYAYWDFDDDAEWYLEKVTVRELLTGEFWNFSCNCWIRDDGLYDDDIGLTPYGSGLTLQPSQ